MAGWLGLRAPKIEDVGSDCTATLYPEYGVIHLKGALSNKEQKALWAKIKRKGVRDPAGANQTTTQFHVSSGTGASKDEPLSEYGKLLYTRSAVELAKQMTEEDCRDEPSFKRLHQIISGIKPVNLNHISGIVYSKQANLRNHQDIDKVSYTMTVSLGDDVEFTVGKKVGTYNNERCGLPNKMRIKSGDAIFFDGGSIPHQVNRILPDTGPQWWTEKRTKNGARVVVIFREELEN